MPAELRAPAPTGGAGAVLYAHAQTSAATTWTVQHNLGHYPAGITVRLVSGEIVEPDREDLDLNTTLLTFITAAAGVAEVV